MGQVYVAMAPSTPPYPPPPLEDPVETDTGIEYEIVFRMNCTHKVREFLADLETWTKKKKDKTANKPYDNRGKHTKMYHEQAREFQRDHPLVPYRDCYRIVCSNHDE